MMCYLNLSNNYSLWTVLCWGISNQASKYILYFVKCVYFRRFWKIYIQIGKYFIERDNSLELWELNFLINLFIRIHSVVYIIILNSIFQFWWIQPQIEDNLHFTLKLIKFNITGLSLSYSYFLIYYTIMHLFNYLIATRSYKQTD